VRADFGCFTGAQHKPMTMRTAVLSLLGGLLVCASILGADGAKVKRVKAGKKYNDHDAVHIVVNKVGCVLGFWRCDGII
jgi:hypothetical protein